MAAIFAWIEINAGAVESTPTNLNFGSVDQTDLDPTLNFILAGNNSFEKYIQADFSGTFGGVSDLRFYISVGTPLATESMLGTMRTSAYISPSVADPVATTSTKAINTIPTANPGSENVGIAGALGNTLSAPGRSDPMVLQLQVDAAAEAGPLSNKTFTMEWFETP